MSKYSKHDPEPGLNSKPCWVLVERVDSFVEIKKGPKFYTGWDTQEEAEKCAEDKNNRKQTPGQENLKAKYVYSVFPRDEGREACALGRLAHHVGENK